MPRAQPPASPVHLPVSEWLPDQPAYSNAGSTLVINALPQSLTSYGPIPSLTPTGIEGIPFREIVIGTYYFVDNTSAVHLYAATEKHLYHLSLATNGAWEDATDFGVSEYHAQLDDTWSFTSFAESVIAVNGGDQPQIQTMGNLTFSTLTEAPFAKCAAAVKDFLFLGNVTELGDSIRYPSRLHWSAIGDAASFPPAGTAAAIQTLSDIQDLRSDLGEIRHIASNLQTSDMAIFMDNGVYVGYFVGGESIFNFQIAQGAVGCRTPSSVIAHEGYVYYLSTSGFHRFDGTSPNPIGAQKCDDFFFRNPNHRVDVAYMDRVQAAADPEHNTIHWLYHGPNSNGMANRMLIYNYQLNRWGFAIVSAQWIGRALSLGYNLDQLDPFTHDTGTIKGIETLPYALDSPAWKGGNPGLYAFNPQGRLSQFGGANMAARLETTELQLSPGLRSRVTSARPLVEGFFPNFFPSKPTVELGYRDRLENPVQYNTPVPLNIYGEAPHRVDSRYFRAIINIPEGAQWDHCIGIELDFASSTPR